MVANMLCLTSLYHHNNGDQKSDQDRTLNFNAGVIKQKDKRCPQRKITISVVNRPALYDGEEIKKSNTHHRNNQNKAVAGPPCSLEEGVSDSEGGGGGLGRGVEGTGGATLATGLGRAGRVGRVGGVGRAPRAAGTATADAFAGVCDGATAERGTRGLPTGDWDFGATYGRAALGLLAGDGPWSCGWTTWGLPVGV
jgi:hypothetical protein